MNRKTIGKKVQKMPQKSASPLKSIKHATSYLRWFDDFMRENFAPQTVKTALGRKTFERRSVPTRVKGSDMTQSSAIPLLCSSELPERAVNKAKLAPMFAAIVPQGDL